VASKKLQRKIARQVSAETLLRFNPEASTLRQQIRGTRKDLRTGVRQERASAAAIAQSADALRPTFDRSTAQAQGAVADAHGMLAEDFAKLGPAAAGIIAASDRDTQGTSSRLAERLATSKQELSRRALDAVAGEALAVRNLRGQAATTVGGLRDRLQNVAKEAGAYQSGRFGELLGDAADRRVTLHGQNVAAREKAADRRSRERINTEDNATSRANAQTRADATGKTKPDRATRTQITAVQDKIDAAVAAARPLVQAQKAANSGKPLTVGQRVALQRLLEEGRASSTDDAGNKDPGVTRQPPRYTSVALDILIDGALSKNNKHILRQRIPHGVKKLNGVPLHKKKVKKPAKSQGIFGQVVDTVTGK
jgi:hypothetical protein